MSATQKTIDSLIVVAGIESIDPEAIRRFISDTLNRNPVDPADNMQVAVLMWGLLRGVRGGDDMNKELRRLLKLRKTRSKIYDPNTAYMGTPEWVIVQQYVSGKITHKEAVKQFSKIHPASQRQLENWIAAIKPDVQITVDCVDALADMIENTAK